MSDVTQMLLSLGVGLVLLIAFIVKTKVHPFLAMIISAAFIGIAGGLDLGIITGTITTGFGNTLASIGIVIGFGCMMGQILEETGAAKVLARLFLRLFGKGKEEWALALTGFVTSIPVFCDSAFIILAPIAKAISKSTKKSIIGLGIVLAFSLTITHATVPPTPGPLGVAALFGINLGEFFLLGIALGFPILFALVAYSKWISRKYYALPGEDGLAVHMPYQEPELTKYIVDDSEELPSVGVTLLPIFLPVFLILLNTVCSALVSEKTLWLSIIQFLGNPVIALALGLLASIYGLTGKIDVERTKAIMDRGIKGCGSIILITGAGGALGQIIKVSGAGNVIADMIITFNITPILLPFIIAAALRLIQGSGTAAMITAASITAPILMDMDVNLLFAAYAACIGSQVFSYHNDSYFWVVNTTLGIKDTKEQIQAYSMNSLIVTFIALIELLIVNAIFG